MSKIYNVYNVAYKDLVKEYGSIQKYISELPNMQPMLPKEVERLKLILPKIDLLEENIEKLDFKTIWTKLNELQEILESNIITKVLEEYNNNLAEIIKCMVPYQGSFQVVIEKELKKLKELENIENIESFFALLDFNNVMGLKARDLISQASVNTSSSFLSESEKAMLLERFKIISVQDIVNSIIQQHLVDKPASLTQGAKSLALEVLLQLVYTEETYMSKYKYYLDPYLDPSSYRNPAFYHTHKLNEYYVLILSSLDKAFSKFKDRIDDFDKQLSEIDKSIQRYNRDLDLILKNMFFTLLEKDDVENFKETILTENKDKDLDKPDGNGYTLLMRAATFSSINIIKELTSNKCDPFKTYSFGNSAFSIAFQEEKEDLAKFFMKNKLPSLDQSVHAEILSHLNNKEPGDFSYYIADNICKKDSVLAKTLEFNDEACQECFTQAYKYCEIVGLDTQQLLSHNDFI